MENGLRKGEMKSIVYFKVFLRKIYYPIACCVVVA